MTNRKFSELFAVTVLLCLTVAFFVDCYLLTFVVSEPHQVWGFLAQAVIFGFSLCVWSRVLSQTKG